MNKTNKQTGFFFIWVVGCVFFIVLHTQERGKFHYGTKQIYDKIRIGPNASPWRLALKRERGRERKTAKTNGESVFSLYYTCANTRIDDDVQQQQ